MLISTMSRPWARTSSAVGGSRAPCASTRRLALLAGLVSASAKPERRDWRGLQPMRVCLAIRSPTTAPEVLLPPQSL